MNCHESVMAKQIFFRSDDRIFCRILFSDTFPYTYLLNVVLLVILFILSIWFYFFLVFNEVGRGRGWKIFFFVRIIDSDRYPFCPEILFLVWNSKNYSEIRLRPDMTRTLFIMFRVLEQICCVVLLHFSLDTIPFQPPPQKNSKKNHISGKLFSACAM